MTKKGMLAQFTNENPAQRDYFWDCYKTHKLGRIKRRFENGVCFPDSPLKIQDSVGDLSVIFI